MNEDNKSSKKKKKSLTKRIKDKFSFKGIAKRIIIAKMGISIALIVFIAVASLSIFGSLIYIFDEEGTSAVTQRAVKETIEENMNIAYNHEHGYYFSINSNAIDKYLEKLNKAYFDGYFFEEDPAPNDEEFVYDPDNPEITKEELEDWFLTDDYGKYLMKMIRTQIASSYPKIGDYYGDDATEDEVGNKIDENGNYVVQGIMTLKRTKINTDGSNGGEIELQYMPYHDFKQLIENNDSRALDHYSFKEDTGQIYYATYMETIIKEVESGTSDTIYVLKEDSFPYEAYANTCSMPYIFLFNMLQVSKNTNYVMALADLLLEESELVVMIQDQINVTTQTHIETYYHAKKTVKDHYREKVVTENNEIKDRYWEFVSSETSYDYPYGNAILKTRVTTTNTNTAAIFVKKAKTWCMDFEQSVNKGTKQVTGTPIVLPESYNKTELAALQYTFESSSESISGSSKTVTSIYKSNSTLLHNTSDKLDVKVYGWQIYTVTEKRINYERFLGLWKNDTGKYIQGAEYNKDGEAVEYELPKGQGMAYPAIDIPDENGQDIDELVGLLRMHNITEMHEILMKYYWNIYFNENVYDVDINNILDLFDLSSFVSADGFGGAFGSGSGVGGSGVSGPARK